MNDLPNADTGFAKKENADTGFAGSPDQQVTIRGREQAFLLYASFCGDVERTAHALNVSPEAVIDMATAGKWNEKLKSIIALKKSTAPGDLERGINRALNFVMAHRYRLFLDRVISRLEDMVPTEFESYLLVDVFDPKSGQTRSSINARPLADLASALEKCSAMSYQALSDTAQDRARREESTEGGETSGSIHAAIAKAMAEVGEDKSPAALLADAQIASGVARAANVIVKPAEPTPYDKG